MADGRDFHGWYLGCTRRHFELNPEPSFSDVQSYYSSVFPRGSDNVLFLPRYPGGTHQRYKNGEEAIIKGRKLRRDGSSEAFRGRIQDVFRQFEEQCGEGLGKPKVVVVDDGYYVMTDFMRSNYGWIREL